MDEFRQFYDLFLPDLINYVVPVLNFHQGELGISSGVLVKAVGRHFIATAEHCIRGKVRVARSLEPLRRDQSAVGMRELRIIGQAVHETLDLAYLEVEDPQCPELSWDQLCTDAIVEGMVHVIGYPQVLTRTKSVSGRLTDVSLAAATFGTTLIERSEKRLTFDYPKAGSKFDPSTGSWFEQPFPKTPKGFSGGACFGVAKPKGGTIARVEYKLLGIQYAWDKVKEVFVVPIAHWKGLVIERGLVKG